MELRVWGARGTYPVSGARFSRYGGHTACLAIASGDDLVVLDAGSGAAALGEVLGASDVRRIHVLLSHFHHDHVMGLPYLVLGARQEQRIAVHACGMSQGTLEQGLHRLFSEPYFPAEETQLFAGLSLHAHVADVRFALGDIAVAAAPLHHPGGSTAFRLAKGMKTLVYATDVEERLEPPPELVRLCGRADLLIHDTTFTQREIASRRGWGHSTIAGAVALAQAADVTRLAGFHHNPAHDDAALEQQERELAVMFPGGFLLREGQCLSI